MLRSRSQTDAKPPVKSTVTAVGLDLAPWQVSNMITSVETVLRVLMQCKGPWPAGAFLLAGAGLLDAFTFSQKHFYIQ